MPILALIEMALQVYFAVHVVTTGKDKYWLYIIIGMPGIGCLIYFFSEYLPEMQNDIRVRRIAKQVNLGFGPSMTPDKKLRFLENQVDLTPSLNNKRELARQYVKSNMFDKAISIYQSCLEGTYKDDSGIHEELSYAYYLKGDHEQALNSLHRLFALRNEFKGDEFDLLYSRVLESLGKTDEAIAAYEKIISKYSGEEARCRYGLLLNKVGRQVEAKEVFTKILKDSEFQPKFYIKKQKEWIKIAKNNLS